MLPIDGNPSRTWAVPPRCATAAMRLVHGLHNPGVLTRQEIVLAPTLCIRGSSRSRVHALPA
ncbi:MAG TPA: hypothetical protein VKF37_01460 [Chloroflexota bacterium]|nr:hypothetical protein [Chloroflexota bacterium]